MKGSEQQMWAALRGNMKAAGLDPVRVENPACPGTPDVSITTGWVELKYSSRWPPKGGPLRVEHYTPQQKVWAIRRRRAGGNCWLLLKVASEWILFDGAVAAQYLGKTAREELLENSLFRWGTKPTAEELKNALN